MNGDNLVARVRRILRDEETASRKGLFWHTQKVRLALNAAQNILLNWAVNNNYLHLLQSLITDTGIMESGVLPTDYFYYLAGLVGEEESSLKTAQVYLGGDGWYYLNTAHYGVVILADNLYFIDDGDSAGSGKLIYYKRPSFIGVTELGDNSRDDFNDIDFENHIYDNIIVNKAAVLLGFQEPQTQREYKRDEQVHKEIQAEPRSLIRTVRDLSDTPMAAIKKVQK